MFRYVLAWIPMLVIAIANGALGELTFGKMMSGLHAHQLSTAIGAVLIGAFVWLVIRLWPPASVREAGTIGIMWLAMTVAFECFMGRVLGRRPWSEVMNDYNLLAGRV